MAKKISDVMTSGPRTITPQTTVAEAARLMRDEDVGSIPIVEGERLVGIVTDRDITVRVVGEGKDAQGTQVSGIASGDLITVRPDQDVEEAARLMARHQVRRLPVVDDGRLVGVLAQADVALELTPEKAGKIVEEVSRPTERPRS